MKLLSRSEEIVLLSIWKLHGSAYGVTIRKQVSKITGKYWSIGAIYAPLHRVEKKGLVKTIKGDPIPERGGRSKIYYEITPRGKKALLEIKKVHDSMWVGIPSLDFERE
jgi:DNA-binding PadR family transcriptional regulator